jgi:alkylation response protein AidB-like acyl-CoA dehydrogenase
MDLSFTPEQSRLIEKFRGWLAKEAPRQVPPRHPERFRAMLEWQRELYGAGWLGRGWPAAYGGEGGEVVEQVIIASELARAMAPSPAGMIGLTLVGPILLEHGTDDQKGRWVAPILSGEEIWCQGYSEPSAGSDLAALNTRAVVDDAGFIVTGQKVWTSFSMFADWCIALVRTDPSAPKHRGITILLVDMRSPGIEVRPLRQITGDAEFGEVFFTDVRVPRENMLGDLNQGWPIAMRLLEHERGPFQLRRFAEISGFLSRIIEAVAHGDLPRPAFDVEQRIGEGEVLVRMLEAQTFAIVTRLLEGRLGVESSAEKLLTTEVEQAVFGLALDLLGPAASAPGAVGEPFAEWLNEYFYGRAGAIYSGTSQIQRNIVAQRMLGLPRA